MSIVQKNEEHQYGWNPDLISVEQRNLVLKYCKDLINTMEFTITSCIRDLEKSFPDENLSQFKEVQNGIKHMKKEFRKKIECHPYLLNKAEAVTSDCLHKAIKEAQQGIHSLSKAKLLEFGLADQSKKLDKKLEEKQKEWEDERAKHAQTIE